MRICTLVNLKHPCTRLLATETFLKEREDRWLFILSTNFQRRSFFQNAWNTSRNLRKEYAGRKLIGYSMEGMFDVVSDVENYKNFLPFCKQSLITSRSENHFKADVVVGFPPLVESYTSNVTLFRPHLVKANCTQFKLFNHLDTTWKFSPGLKNNKNTCIIDFYVSFEFRSRLHSQIAHIFFNELVRQMEGAFYQEARKRYGEPSLKTQYLGEPEVTS